MTDILPNIKSRVLYLAEKKGLAKKKFCEDIGMTYGNFTGKSKDTPLNSTAVGNILSIIPDVNLNWLLTGEGSMLKEVEPVRPQQVFPLKTDNPLGQQLIPIYNLEASAGLVSLFQHYADVTPIDHLSIPNLPRCDGAIFITGDSMYPLLKSGDIVVYKEINDIRNNIFWGEMYLVSIDVEGEEYVAVKYIQRSDKGDEYITLASQNQHHAPKDVMLASVRAMAIIKASVRINAMR